MKTPVRLSPPLNALLKVASLLASSAHASGCLPDPSFGSHLDSGPILIAHLDSGPNNAMMADSIADLKEAQTMTDKQYLVPGAIKPTESITLYGYATSPFVMKVAAYLRFKGLEYTHVHVRPVKNEAIRFTKQSQVPVLKIGEEWRTDSSQLGIWLDELFPEKPLLPTDVSERERVLAIDAIISDTLIPARFREAVDFDSRWHAMRNGWRLAQVVHAGTPIPLMWRLMWPFAVSKAPFIIRMVDTLDRSEPIAHMRERMLDILEEQLGDGPYLGGLNAPSLADFSIYPVVVSPYMLGMHGDFPWLRRPRLLTWMKYVQKTLPSNPFPYDDRFMAREWPF